MPLLQAAIVTQAAKAQMLALHPEMAVFIPPPYIPYTNAGIYVWPARMEDEWYDVPVYSSDGINWTNFGVAFCSWTNPCMSFNFNIEANFYTIQRFTSAGGWSASWIPTNIAIQ
jgi:hypothetical protein